MTIGIEGLTPLSYAGITETKGGREPAETLRAIEKSTGEGRCSVGKASAVRSHAGFSFNYRL